MARPGRWGMSPLTVAKQRALWHAPAVGRHVTACCCGGEAGGGRRQGSLTRHSRSCTHALCLACAPPHQTMVPSFGSALLGVYRGLMTLCVAHCCAPPWTRGGAFPGVSLTGVVLTGLSPLVPRSRCRAASAAAQPAGFPIKRITKRSDWLGPAGSLSSRRGRYR